MTKNKDGAFMNMKKTLAGIFAGALALSAMAVPASAAVDQRAKSTTFDFETNIYQAVIEAELETESSKLTYDFAKGNYKFNFDLETTFPKSSGKKNLTVKKVANIDGDYAELTFYGYKTEADTKKTSKTIKIEVSDDGYYEFEILAAGEVAGRNEIAEDSFYEIDSITFEGDISFNIPASIASKTYFEGSKAAIVGVNWYDSGKARDNYGEFRGFDDFEDYDDLKIEIQEGDSYDGVVLGANTTYSINDFMSGLTKDITSYIGTNQSATISFEFLDQYDLYKLDKNFWKPIFDGDDDNIPEASISSSWLKRSGVGVNFSTSTNNKLYSIGTVDGNSLVVEWDDLCATFNTTTAKVNSINIQIPRMLVLGSITVDIPQVRITDETTTTTSETTTTTPATTAKDLSLGQGNEQTEGTVAEATNNESVTTHATSAAGNVPTGNAPIALAAIPVALIAAVVVAKTSKK